MKNPVIEKVTVNIGVGEGGGKLEKAATLLEKLTGKKPARTKTMKRIPTFGIRPRMFVGTMVTLRGADAEAFLKRALAAKEGIPRSSIDGNGNFSFGIKEYIDIPNMNYDPDIGVFGMDVCVTIGRKGFRVKRRRMKRGRVGASHLVTREDTVKFLKEKFNVEVSE
jgi:large subunit ribosomal protein L5